MKLNAPDTGHFDTKLEGYHAMGVHEVVCFDVDAVPGARLRVWDLIDGDMVERVVTEECTSCVALSASTAGRHFEWLVAPADAEPAALRLRCDGALVLTPDEHAASLTRERDAAAGERDDALARPGSQSSKGASAADSRASCTRPRRLGRPRRSD